MFCMSFTVIGLVVTTLRAASQLDLTVTAQMPAERLKDAS